MKEHFPDQAIIFDSLEHVITQKEILRASIKRTIDGYWSWFNAENTNIAELRKVGMTKLHVSNIAPVIESRQSGESVLYYILWKSHKTTFRKNIKKGNANTNSPSIQLHNHDSLKIKAMLNNKCSWDAKKAVSYESHFEYLRAGLKGLHEAEVRLRSAARKIQKISTQLSESQPQEETHYD